MKLARAATISKVLLEEGLGFLLQDAPTPDVPPSHELGVRLRKTLERLGPTFVKFGQMLATRVDLFDEALLAELAHLHASVPPFDSARARAIVEAELGRPVDEVFDAFPDEPVASASIAQVYDTRLREGGQRVAVKVQRPDLDQTLLADLDALVASSGYLDRLVPPYHRSMVHRVAEEYASRARDEIDFESEQRAMERFADVLATLPEFRVPITFPALCTRRVLVMEWLDGTRLDRVEGPAALKALGFDPADFGRSMLKLQLSMCYEHGFVHGDTHPGNLVLQRDGRVGLLDFGLHADLGRALRDRMLELVFFQASGRIDEAVEAFASVFQAEPGTDLAALKRDLKGVLAEGGRKGALREHRITEQLVNGMRVGARYRVRTRSELFTVIRNLTIVEGIVLRYCPDLDAVSDIEGITGDILRRKVFGAGMRKELTELVPQVLLTLSQRPRLVERLLELERRFNDARTLGAFLRAEDVLREPEAPRVRPLPLVVAALIGLVVGLVVGLGVR